MRNRIITIHYIKFIYRIILFLLGAFWYIYNRVNGLSVVARQMIPENKTDIILSIITVAFAVEMVLRMIPSNLVSPGCQKHFNKNYAPTGKTAVIIDDHHATAVLAMVWIVGNAIIGAAYKFGIIDEGLLWIVCLLYGVGDLVCVLFFCPFQSWFLKNRCCTTCRIYNWDYPFLVTPLIFIPSVRTWILVGLAFIILLKWELSVWIYPERFSKNTNAYLQCENCPEKLCQHKPQLNRLSKRVAKQDERHTNRILEEK